MKTAYEVNHTSGMPICLSNKRDALRVARGFVADGFANVSVHRHAAMWTPIERIAAWVDGKRVVA